VFVSNQGDKGRRGSVSVYDVKSRRGRLEAATPFLVPDGGFAALAVDPDGRLLYATGHLGSEHVVFGYRLDKGARHLTPVADPPVLARGGIAPATLRVHPSGRFLYMVAVHGISAYEVADTGTLTEVGLTVRPESPAEVGRARPVGPFPLGG
jgi:6-phosphogluconolactonase (cycloisomerase 2 family)